MSRDSSHLAVARRVIADEAAGLAAMADTLGDSFDLAIDLILAAEGRIIVSGIGKSGQIAHKVAATFASTGTPAQFVHPAEASHGDMGMVTRKDIVLALSNSGEAPELANLIAHTRRFAIPLVAITAQADGNLARHADIKIVLPPLEEACGYGVVPTTSTTVVLALGDAMAIALMQARAFTPDDFRDLHPGGNLGARLSKVRDLMHSGDAVPMVGMQTPMSDVLLTISQKGFGVVGVQDDDGRLVGAITDGDLRRHMNGLMALTASEVMTKDPRTVGPDSLAQAAVGIMSGKITCLFVVDPAQSSRVVGILHIHDCLRAGVV